MKITTRILSIPPYLSTTWKNISSLHVKEGLGHLTLVVFLQNGTSVEVPNLDRGSIDEIFEAHARSTEEHSAPTLPGPFGFSLPLQGDSPIQTFETSMQHNPEQTDLPPIPPAVLKKISMITRVFGIDNILPKGEPNCNCVYCQIVRSVQGEEMAVEEVSDEDLKFRTWEIEEVGEKLYKVTNPLDPNEHYNVFLGTPIGCTCGSQNCEHIQTVLKS